MKIVAKIIWIILLTVSVSNSWANGKIGIINRAVLLEKAPQAESSRNKLKREFSSRDQSLVRLQKEAENLLKKFQREKMTMSESARRSLEKKILRKKREIKADREAFEEDFNIRRNEELNGLQSEVKKAIEYVGKNGGYDVILAEGFVYLSAKSSMNITSEVLKQLRKQYGR